MDTKEVFKYIEKSLSEHGITEKIETLEIYKAVFNEYIIEAPKRQIENSEFEKVKKLINKRINGYPLQYISGLWPFLDFEVYIGEGVLIPRPETEDLVSLALYILEKEESPKVLDLCAGTGCISIAIKRAKKCSKVTAVELFDSAFSYLKRNISKNAVDIEAAKGDVFGFEETLDNSNYDLIICNPPYITATEYMSLEKELYFEPKEALTDNKDGLSFYQYISKKYYNKLKYGGHMIFEIGHGKGQQVKNILQQAKYTDIELFKDRYANERTIVAKK